MRNRASYHEGFAPRDGRPLYPSLWRGCVGAWNPGLGCSGLILRDWAGLQSNGTLTAGPIWSMVGGASAITYDGTDDYTGCGTSSQLNPTTAISISAWVRVPADMTTRWICARDDNALGRSFAFGIGRSTFASITLQINGSSVMNSAAYVNNLKSLEHIAFTGSAAAGYIGYINGIQVATGVWSAPAATTGETTIGKRTYAGFQGYFTGDIGEVRLYDRALTALEIRLLSRRQGIANELAQRRRASAATGNRRRRLLIGAH